MMETSSPKGHRRHDASADQRAVERDALLHRLLDSVKQCQIRFGKKPTTSASAGSATVATTTTTLATEAEAQVICLLTNLEATFSHGLKQPSGAASASLSLGGLFSAASSSDNSRQPLTFWPFVKTFLGADELARFDSGSVVTDLGRGRAWLRTALNENTLERYFYSMVNDGGRIKAFYEPWSFMLDEEKSSVLPSMAAGLRTILFNVAVDGPALDQVPKSLATNPDGGRTILNSIPLGGIIRDTIMSSSLPNNYNGNPGNPHAASSFADNDSDSYLEPVIMSSMTKISEKEPLKSDKRALSSSSNCDKVSLSSSLIATKRNVKKKKKTVANIVNLDKGDDSKSVGASAGITPLPRTTTDVAPAPTTSSIQRHRTAHPPSALTIPTVEPPPPTVEVAAPDIPLTAETKEKSSSSASSEMRFVCGGNSGDVMSPITPATPMILVAHDVPDNNNPDYDSSDAVSVKSAGQISQGSVASSTTSDLSTSAYLLNGSGSGIVGGAVSNSSHPLPPPPHSRPSPAPTLLSLRNERFCEEPCVAASSASTANVPTALTTTTVTTAATTTIDGKDDIDSLSVSDLRVAIVSIMRSKDRMAVALEESRQRGDESVAEVDQLRQQNATLRDGMEKLERKVTEAETNADSKCKFLQRENQLLKHQLKKYVGTVQSLQRQQTVDGADGDTAIDAALEKMSVADGNGGAAITSGSGSGGDDVDQIRESYEQKLVQVSEMHSELMEFNDQLVMQIKLKDRLLEGYRTELEDLRGPLPLDYANDNADTMSLASEVDDMLSCSSSINVIPSSSSSCSFRALVNIWIPSAFLQTSNKDTFHVYQVYIRIRDEEWNVYRRYAQFYELHKSKKKQFTDIATIPFPPKKALGNKDEQFVEDRRVKLQQYLRQLLNYLTQCTGYELAHAHPITKERLLNALPFFSDRALTSSESASGRSGRFVSSVSRGRLQTAEEPTTPQYMGL